MEPYLLSLAQIDHNSHALVGGKAANLASLTKIEKLTVPAGICLTTQAFRDVVQTNPHFQELLQQLTQTKSSDQRVVAALSRRIRQVIEDIELPEHIIGQLTNALESMSRPAYAIRSSATAEDLSEISFAGQQDTYLNVYGIGQITHCITKCWASLYNERAVAYRIKHGFDHWQVTMAVIIQEMVMADSAGVLFTADPLTSDRETLSIEASFGLGEAVVSGVTEPDNYQVIGSQIVAKKIGQKKEMVVASPDGGTACESTDSLLRQKVVLTDHQILALSDLGREIEAHFDYPQDVEWCLAQDRFFIVQSRPITTLFPIPRSEDRRMPRVYMSIGHTQMMTDPIRPLGMSFFQAITNSTLTEAGGRPYADITHDLSSPLGRKRLIIAGGKQDPLIREALETLVEDKQFMASLPKGKRNIQGGVFTPASLWATIRMYRQNDPTVITAVTGEFEKELQELDSQLRKLSGSQALEFIEEDRKNLLAMAYHPTVLGAIIVAILVNDSLNKQVQKWVGKKQIADTLTKSLDNNVTTQMGLTLGDLSDTIRALPEVIEYFKSDPSDDTFLNELASIPGGKVAIDALQKFFSRYGMRCPGEIDISKPRFKEKPTQLIPLILSNIRVLSAGEHRKRFVQGRKEALETAEQLIEHVKTLPRGKSKARKLRKAIDLLRNFSGCRELPKYYIIRRYDIYKQAILREAAGLVAKQLIKQPEDVFYLYFPELQEAVRHEKLDYSLIDKRRLDYLNNEKLTPPRVITSSGLVPRQQKKRLAIPENALPGVAVSSGVVEGRARIVHQVTDANFEPGDILVTSFTDPSWTPVFTTIKGLVTEVGGFTTHGAVVTREYGLPGVVGVVNATKLIRDGQRIRVNGSEGYVELL